MVLQTKILILVSKVLFCSLAVLDPRIGHIMDVLSPFTSVLCPRSTLLNPGGFTSVSANQQISRSAFGALALLDGHEEEQ